MGHRHPPTLTPFNGTALEGPAMLDEASASLPHPTRGRAVRLLRVARPEVPATLLAPAGETKPDRRTQSASAGSARASIMTGALPLLRAMARSSAEAKSFPLIDATATALSFGWRVHVCPSVETRAYPMITSALHFALEMCTAIPLAHQRPAFSYGSASVAARTRHGS